MLTYCSWCRYTDKQNKDVCDAMVEEIKASGSQHSANETKRNLLTLYTVYLSLPYFSILYTSSTEAVYRCYDGKRHSWNDMRPSRQAQVERNKEKSSRRAKQTQVSVVNPSFIFKILCCNCSSTNVEQNI